MALISLQVQANRNATNANQTSREIADRAQAQAESFALRGWELEQRGHRQQERQFTLSTLPVLNFSTPLAVIHKPSFTAVTISFNVTNIGTGLALFAQVSVDPTDARFVDYTGEQEFFTLAPGDTISRSVVVGLLIVDDAQPGGISFRERGDVGTIRASYRDIRNDSLSTSVKLAGSLDFSELRFSDFQYVPEVFSRNWYEHT